MFACLRESGVYAFYLPAQLAANIPSEYGAVRKTESGQGYLLRFHSAGRHYQYGRRGTDTVLTLAAVHTLNVPVDLPTALLAERGGLAVCLQRLHGVAGGSLLLIAGVQHVWHPERYRDAGSSGRLYYRRIAGFV